MRVVESSVYSKWFGGLKDRVAKARIDRRIKRAARGDYGDVKPVGEKNGSSEFLVERRCFAYANLAKTHVATTPRRGIGDLFCAATPQ